MVFADPGSPWQNAWIESFSGRVRDQFMNGTQSGSFFEAQARTGAWRIDCNNHRAAPARCWLTPVEFAGRWVRRQRCSSRSG